MPSEVASGWSPAEYVALASVISSAIVAAGSGFVGWLQHRGTLTHQKAEALKGQVRDAMRLVAAIELAATEAAKHLAKERVRLVGIKPRLEFENGLPPEDPPFGGPWREPDQSRLKYSTHLKELQEGIDALNNYVAVEGVFLPERIENALREFQATVVREQSIIWGYEHVFITNFWRDVEYPFRAFGSVPERCNLVTVYEMTSSKLGLAIFKVENHLIAARTPLRAVMREYLGSNLDVVRRV